MYFPICTYLPIWIPSTEYISCVILKLVLILLCRILIGAHIDDIVRFIWIYKEEQKTILATAANPRGKCKLHIMFFLPPGASFVVVKFYIRFKVRRHFLLKLQLIAICSLCVVSPSPLQRRELQTRLYTTKHALQHTSMTHTYTRVYDATVCRWQWSTFDWGISRTTSQKIVFNGSMQFFIGVHSIFLGLNLWTTFFLTAY